MRWRHLQDVQQTSGAEGEGAGRGHEPPLPERGGLLPGDNLVNYVNQLSTEVESIGRLSSRYTLFKYAPVLEFGNLLNYTAMGLGNHDFDDGVGGLAPFAEEANYPG